jgi:hypothetical protein
MTTKINKREIIRELKNRTLNLSHLFNEKFWGDYNNEFKFKREVEEDLKELNFLWEQYNK